MKKTKFIAIEYIQPKKSILFVLRSMSIQRKKSQERDEENVMHH